MQSDTTATVRKEILEEKKREIDAQIENYRLLKDAIGGDDNGAIDTLIDDLQLEKDNLPVTLFDDERNPCPACEGTGNCAIHGLEPSQCSYCNGTGIAPDGTYPSPIIGGGDVLELGEQHGHADIPF